MSDGTNIWVVNDSTGTDKVFRYTVSGTLQGFWTISTTSPTGITLDPTNSASPLWIVDNANDSVYQFARPASISTSGALSGSVFFALAAGNTNPQGIADPPAGLTPTPVVATNDSRPVASKAISLLAPQVALGNQPATGDAQSQQVITNLQGVDQYMSTLARLASTPSSAASSYQWSGTFNSMFSATTDDDQSTDGELAESESSDLMLQLSQNLLQSNNR